MAMLAEAGTLTLANNWAKTGWRNSHEGGGFSGSVTGAATMVTGTDPGFVNASQQNFELSAGAQTIDAGTSLHSDVLPIHNVTRHYVRHQNSAVRPVNGQFDLGAYEFAVSTLPPVITTGSFGWALMYRHFERQLEVSGGTGPLQFAVVEGSLPPGVTLNTVTGRIHGRPRLKGSTVATISVTDSLGLSSTRQFVIETKLHQ